MHYSTFDKELLAIYLAINHFKHIVEGIVYTDHKPLTHAMKAATEYSPLQTWHLTRIAEFTSDIRHISGKVNAAADALSRDALPMQAITWLPDLDYTHLAGPIPETHASRTAITGLVWQDQVLDDSSTLLCGHTWTIEIVIRKQLCHQCLSSKACGTASKLPIAKGSKCENEKLEICSHTWTIEIMIRK